MSILKEVEELIHRREYDYGNGPHIALLGSMSWTEFTRELKETMEQHPTLPTEDQGCWIAGVLVLQFPLWSSGVLIVPKKEADTLLRMFAQQEELIRILQKATSLLNQIQRTSCLPAISATKEG